MLTRRLMFQSLSAIALAPLVKLIPAQEQMLEFDLWKQLVKANARGFLTYMDAHAHNVMVASKLLTDSETGTVYQLKYGFDYRDYCLRFPKEGNAGYFRKYLEYMHSTPHQVVARVPEWKRILKPVPHEEA